MSRALVAAIALCLIGVFALPASPALAASCHDTSCNGVDPQSAGCSGGAVTIDSLSDQGFYLELRYSSACYAAWTRVTSQGYADVTADFWIARYSGQRYSGHFSSGETGAKWTKMISFDYAVTGCLGTVYRGNTATYCTAFH
jgi:hypothetical protein